MNQKLWIVIGIIIVLVIFGIVLAGGKKQINPVEVKLSSQDEAVQTIQNEAATLAQNKDFIKAKSLYQQIIAEHPDYVNIESVQRELEDLNLEIILSNTTTEKTIVHEIKTGDTLGSISRQYNVTVDFLKKSNNLKSDIIRLGQKLRIWPGNFNIYVDKSQNILILKDGEEVVKVYNVSTGANNSTPVGEFKITVKLIDPVWFNKGVVVPPESPENVLGSRWLGFDLQGYGIHGTIEPQTIGQQVTAGCVRMKNEDVEELYTLIPIGTRVTIVD